MSERDRERPGELIRQSAALGTFGEFALKSDDLDEVLTQACQLVSTALGTELAKVLEAGHNETELLVRAGVGWRPGIVGRVVIPTGSLSGAGHALATGEAVISNDIEKEGRFTVPEFMREHGVSSMVNTIILGPDGQPPYGVLEVDSRTRRNFSQDDVDFLRSYANLISSAVMRFRATEALRREAERNERLVHELQHRVKNNFQVLSSLVSLQISRSASPDAQRELRAIGDRLETLRLVHDQLHAVGGADQVDVGSYLGVLASSIIEFHAERSEKVGLVTELDRMIAPSEVAVPVGMVATEFITNSLKYAFEGKPGTIGVRLEAVGSGLARLTLWDDGKGLQGSHVASTGMRLIAGFIQQLRADPVWEAEQGTRLVLTIPLGEEAAARAG